MFVMDCCGHKLPNGVLFAHHLILDVPGGSSHLGYRRRVSPGHYPTTGVNKGKSSKDGTPTQQAERMTFVPSDFAPISKLA